jgi:hypothetical protein
MNNLQIENVTVSEFSETLRQVVREELSAIQSKKQTSNYLTRKEVSKLLKISLPTLGEYTKKGIIKGSRIGSRVLYLESDIALSVAEITTIKYRRD